MKKILFLLLSTVAMYGQVPADATPLENIQITNNTTDNSATKVNVQSTDGTINTISKSDLVNVVEVNDVPSLPLVGEVGKIYVVKNVNKIYRWNGTFYQKLEGTDISGLQAQIDLKANDSDVVKLIGDQTISGQKSFSLTGKIDMQTDNAFPAISVTSLGGNGLAAAEFINNSSSPYSRALRLRTNLDGGVGNVTLSVWNQSPIGTGIYSNASSGGVSISSESHNGDSYISNIALGGTGRNYVGRNNGTETYSVDKTGNVIGNSYIKRSTPANNILLAGGGDLAQGTAFNKNFGTTAGTVVEGGTLGSNAYSSTAFAPLNGTGANGTWGINISGNAGTATNSSKWNNQNFEYAGIGSISGYIIGKGADGTWRPASASETRDWLGLGTNAYTSTAFLPLSGGTLAGIVTAPTATAGTNTTQIATTAFVLANSSARPYKVYTALLTQTGTNAPVATVLENTLGTVTFTRSSTGVYFVNSSGLFTADKTFVIMGAGDNAGAINAINLINSSAFSIVTKALSTHSDADSANTKVAFEIRVYL